MAKKYKLVDHSVKFTLKPEVKYALGDKLVYSDYDINDNGDITWHKPIINAIDIDWSNATTTEITDAINSSGDLIYNISENKKSIRLTNETITSIQSQITEISNSLENISHSIDEQVLVSINESLTALSNRITAIENGQVNVDLTEIQNRINEINTAINNLRIPVYVNDLVDGYDVLRRSNFETIKNELKGDSAYDIAKRLAQENNEPFPYANEAEWLASLKGSQGPAGSNGSSAFDIAKRTALILGADFPYQNEIEWMMAITQGSDDREYIDQRINELRNEFNIGNTYSAGDGIIIENGVISASSNTWIKL